LTTSILKLKYRNCTNHLSFAFKILHVNKNKSTMEQNYACKLCISNQGFLLAKGYVIFMPHVYIYHHLKLGNLGNWEHKVTEVQKNSMMHLCQKIMSNTILTNLEGMLRILTKKPMLSKKEGSSPCLTCLKHGFNSLPICSCPIYFFKPISNHTLDFFCWRPCQFIVFKHLWCCFNP
jgi:hypothetical protein